MTGYAFGLEILFEFIRRVYRPFDQCPEPCHNATVCLQRFFRKKIVQSNARTIGIDIGGPKIAIGLVNQRGQIEHRITFATEPERGFPVALEKISHGVE